MRAILISALAVLWAASASAQLREVAPPSPPKAPAPAPAPAAPSAPAPGEDALYMGGFNGTWVGKLRTIDPATYDDKVGAGKPGDESEYAIVVSGATAKVYYRKGGSWSEVKPGAFRIASHKTNAVVYATDSSSDVYDTTGSGGWVESWTYTLTHKNSTVVYVGWWRAVNNYLLKPSEENSRFFRAAFGEMKQVPALPD